MKKTAIFLTLTVLLLTCFNIMCQAANPTVSLSAGDVSDNKLKVNVVLTENPGIIVMRLKLSYDKEALTLTKIEDKGQLGENNHTDNLNQDDIYLYWSNPTATENYTFSGSVATLYFDVKKAAQNADISISYDFDNYDIIDFNLNKVKFDIKTAGIDLTGEPIITGTFSQNTAQTDSSSNKLGYMFYIGVAVFIVLIAAVVVMIYVKKHNEKVN